MRGLAGKTAIVTGAASGIGRAIATRLGAEGIVRELRGNVDGPYPIGPVEVLVAQEDLAVAREVVVEQVDDDMKLPVFRVAKK